MSTRPAASSPRSSTSAGRPTWLIELRDGGGPIGLCGWRRPQPHIVDFGYCLGRRWWRQGFMSEVVQLLLDEARARSDRVPGVRVLPCRQHAVGAGAGTQRSYVGGPAGAVRHVSEHQRRAAGLPAVRQGAQVTTPRTAHARPRKREARVRRIVHQPVAQPGLQSLPVGFGQRCHVDAGRTLAAAGTAANSRRRTRTPSRWSTAARRHRAARGRATVRPARRGAHSGMCRSSREPAAGASATASSQNARSIPMPSP